VSEHAGESLADVTPEATERVKEKRQEIGEDKLDRLRKEQDLEENRADVHELKFAHHGLREVLSHAPGGQEELLKQDLVQAVNDGDAAQFAQAGAEYGADKLLDAAGSPVGVDGMAAAYHGEASRYHSWRADELGEQYDQAVVGRSLKDSQEGGFEALPGEEKLFQAADRLNEAKAKLSEAAGEAKDHVIGELKDRVEQVGDKIDSVREDVSERLHDLRDEADEVVDKVHERLEAAGKDAESKLGRLRAKARQWWEGES
jgi:gas vesicle protein